MSILRRCYNAPMENITYRNLSIKQNHLLESFIYESDSGNEETTD